MHTFSTRRSVLFASMIALSVLLLAEGVLRVVGVGAPVQPRLILRLMDTDIKLPFMRADPDTFWSPLPGYAGEFMGKAVRINALGLRGGEIAQPRPTQRRLACFGDSITFGYGVADDETYPHALGLLLSGRGVEVVNAGVTGFTSHQVLASLRRVGPQVRPDVATFCIGWNDGNRRPVDDRDYARRLGMVGGLSGTLDHVYLFRGLKSLYLRAVALRGIDPARGARNATERVPLPQYRENLESIVGECRRQGIRPVFVALPRRRTSGEPDADAPYASALVAAGGALGVPVLDSGVLGLNAPRGNERYFIDTLHLNPEGNRLLAEALARQLVENGLL